MTNKKISMTINFLVQSKYNPAPIYIRIKEGRTLDVKLKTKFNVDPDYFKKGEALLKKNSKGLDELEKQKNNSFNKNQIKINSELDSIKNTIMTKVNNGDIELTRAEINDILNLKLKTIETKIPTRLIELFDEYFVYKQTQITASTKKKLKVFQNRIEKFEEEYGIVDIKNINKSFSYALQKWMDDKNYAHNTKVKTLKVIKTICNFAIDKGLKVHEEYNSITKGLTYKNIEHIHLNFAEIKKILNAKIESEELIIARDWLIISCFTAQRISDFLKFNQSNLVKHKNILFLDIRQEKTASPVLIPLTKEVQNILKKYNGNFPPYFSKNKDSNEAIYNRLIKKVCEKAEINTKITVFKKNKETNRYEYKVIEKHEAVSSHIGRRSFATNYYGEINTSLLISATGHSTEVQFLRYVGKQSTQNAVLLANELNKIKI
jgi:integrase